MFFITSSLESSPFFFAYLISCRREVVAGFFNLGSYLNILISSLLAVVV
jgi:hypothetical protein